MHVGLTFDAERIQREPELIPRVLDGLVERGIQVTTIVPDDDDLGDGLLPDAANRIEYATNILPWGANARIERIVAAMEKAVPDVIYVCGRHAWSMGIHLARRLDVPAAVECWSMEDMRHLPRGRQRERVAAFVAPTAPIAQELRVRVGTELVSTIPVGVPPVHRDHDIMTAEEIGVVVVGRGEDLSAYRAFLEGLAVATAERPDVRVFMELRGPHAHDVWRLVDRFELHAVVSSLTDAAPYRRLLTECDLLVVPERTEGVRTIVLEAMAQGMLVLASGLPMIDSFDAESTGIIVSGATSTAWRDALRRVLSNPDETRAIGAAAQRRCRADHSARTHLDELVTTLDRIVGGDSMPFTGAT